MESFKGPRLPILFLLYAKNKEVVAGAIRMQKLVFLLKEEYKVSKRSFTSINFKPHKFGMYSPQIQDDLIFLNNLNLISSNKNENSDLDFMMDEEDEFLKSVEYWISDDGVKFVENIIADAKNDDPDKIKRILEACEDVKEKYNSGDIRDLLKYVYRKYPKYTVNSEIITKILGKY